MRSALAVFLAAIASLCLFVALGLISGCASSPVRITYGPGEAGTFASAQPVLRSVEVSPEAYGRQCFDLSIEPDGTVGITYAVDASSDYAGVRVLPSILPEIVSAVMTAVGAPIDMIGELLGVKREPLPAPSALSACHAIFEE